MKDSSAVFMGVDDNFGMLLRDEDGTTSNIPLQPYLRNKYELARAIHFDESDTRVYSNSARTGEWCVPGGFEFSNWSEADLDGKAKASFSNGWFGLETSGRVTFVAVARLPHKKYHTLKSF